MTQPDFDRLLTDARRRNGYVIPLRPTAYERSVRWRRLAVGILVALGVALSVCLLALAVTA